MAAFLPGRTLDYTLKISPPHMNIELGFFHPSNRLNIPCLKSLIPEVFWILNWAGVGIHKKISWGRDRSLSTKLIYVSHIAPYTQLKGSFMQYIQWHLLLTVRSWVKFATCSIMVALKVFGFWSILDFHIKKLYQLFNIIELREQ